MRALSWAGAASLTWQIALEAAVAPLCPGRIPRYQLSLLIFAHDFHLFKKAGKRARRARSGPNHHVRARQVVEQPRASMLATGVDSNVKDPSGAVVLLLKRQISKVTSRTCRSPRMDRVFRPAVAQICLFFNKNKIKTKQLYRDKGEGA